MLRFKAVESFTWSWKRNQ